MTTPYGYQQPAPMGRLVVHSSYHWLSFLFAITGVKVEINGHPTNVSWGEAPFDLPAGNYHLQVSARWVGRFGTAQLPVTVYPGQLVTVYYKPPSFKWSRGALGFTPQKTPGLAAAIIVNVVSFFVLVLFLIVLFSR